MKSSSLAIRLFLITSVMTLVILVAAGVFLSELYRNSAQSAFERELDLYARNLIGLVQQNPDGSLSGSPDLGDPRFGAISSGWNWQVEILRDGEDIDTFSLRSRSLAGDDLDLVDAEQKPFDVNFRRTMTGTDPSDTSIFIVQRLVTLESNDTAAFTVTGSLTDLAEEVESFQTLLSSSLAILGLTLVAATLVVVRIGLRPLTRMREQIQDVRAGELDKLDSDFPAEINPIATELNELIRSNKAIIERARTHVGNLAHALKTPLSVIRNEISSDTPVERNKISEQIELMRSQVSHHLDRAQMAARANVVGAITEVVPSLEALVRAMTKIYASRGVDIFLDSPESVKFAGEQQDFEEIIGNLVDNACKWSKSEVSVKVWLDQTAEEQDRKKIHVCIEDDGPGLTDEEAVEVLRRGARLDETTPGSGLGLSIVSELVSLYDGSFELEKSEKGGLKVNLSLPAA